MIILILLLNIFFASSFIIGKAVLQYSSPLFFVGFRMCLAGIILLGYNYFFNGNRFKYSKNDWLLLLKLSLVHIYLPFVLEFWALQYVTAAKTSLLFNLSPFITAILSYISFGEKLNSKKLTGLLIGFFGFIPILIEKSYTESSVCCEIFYMSLPELCIILSVISSCYAWIIVQNEAKKSMPISVLNGASMLGGGTIALASSLIFEKWTPTPVLQWDSFLALTILIVIMVNLISYNLYSFLLTKYTATFLSFCGFLIAFFTAIEQWIFFKTPVTLAFYISAILVTFGLFVFYQEELKKGIVKEG